MAKKKDGRYEVGSGAPHGNVSEDTAVEYANASRELLIPGDLNNFDVEGWGNGVKEFKVGGTVDGNAPFNVEEVHDLKTLMNNFNSDAELQDAYILKNVVDGIGLVR
jgi:hypothetical protein